MIVYPAKYTVVLKSLIDNEQTKALIDNALSKYKLYEPKSKNEYIPRIVPTREEINRAILDYYKYREIGFETVGRFIDELEIAMNEIMPYYNQILFTQDQDFNIIYNVDYVRQSEANRQGESTNSSTASNTGNSTTEGESKTNTSATDSSSATSNGMDASKHIQSKTPQSELLITAKNIDSVDYADEVDWNKAENEGTTNSNGESSSESDNEHNQTTTSSLNGESSSNGTSKDTENIVETVKGNYGQVSAQRLVITYRESIINTVQQIVRDKRIAELFMLVY